jgi:IclR family transcriptional regulator, KDG regulon repressor
MGIELHYVDDAFHTVKPLEVAATGQNQRDTTPTTALRALAMLDVVVGEPRGISLAVAADRVGLSKATSLRLLKALIRAGYVLRDADEGNYRPSLKIVRMGEQVLGAYDFATFARHHMLRLSDAVGHGVAAGIIDGDQVIYVARIEASTEIRVHHQVGGRRPIHASSIGKAIVAYMPDRDVDELLSDYNFEQFTPNTIVDRESFLNELLAVRSRGWALVRNEGILGGSSISAPVFSHTGQVVGAIGVSSVSAALQGAELDRMVKLLVVACKATSADLGFAAGVHSPCAVVGDGEPNSADMASARRSKGR